MQNQESFIHSLFKSSLALGVKLHLVGKYFLFPSKTIRVLIALTTVIFWIDYIYIHECTVAMGSWYLCLAVRSGCLKMSQ